MWKDEIRVFFTALMFYTRIPCPKNTDHSPEYINRATRYFPLIGWIVGAISFAFYYGASHLFDTTISTAIALVVGVLVTGAFHEDGLADVFDGFGGGWTKQNILDIMKDSRVGAFGLIATVFLLLIKFLALSQVLHQFDNAEWYWSLLIFIVYHSLARLTAVCIVFTSEYSREDASSKAKPIAKGYGAPEVVGAFVFGLTPFLLFTVLLPSPIVLFVLAPIFVLYWRSKKYFEKWIDGYTGDCLGAVEQMAEMIVLLSILALWKFI